MPQSLAKVIVHIVYSTKSREPWLEDKTIRGELFAYNASILSSSMDCPTYPGLRRARTSLCCTLG